MGEVGSGKKSFLKYETTGTKADRTFRRRKKRGNEEAMDGRSYSAPFGVPST